MKKKWQEKASYVKTKSNITEEYTLEESKRKRLERIWFAFDTYQIDPCAGEKHPNGVMDTKDHSEGWQKFGTF